MGDEADDVIAPLEDEGEGGESQGEDWSSLEVSCV